MRYPPLPWPEDVPRRPMPPSFTAPIMLAVGVGVLMAKHLRPIAEAAHDRHMRGEERDPMDPPICLVCGKRLLP